MRLPGIIFVAFIGVFAVDNAWSSDDAALIRELRMQSNEAIARHDVKAIQSYLHDDFVITISNGSIERSREEHGRSFAEHFKDYPDVIYVRTPTEIDISQVYPLAMEQGTWFGKRKTVNGNIEIGGRYTAAWRQTESGWRIYSELFVALYCEGNDC